MRKGFAAFVAASLAVLFTGCQTLDGQGAATNAGGAQVGRPAAGGNMFPSGRRAPNLQGDERALYQAVVADLQNAKSDPSVFNTSAALAVELDADTQSLLAHQRTEAQFAILNRGNDIRYGTNMRELPLEVSLLEGTVKDGKIDGEFDAVTRYETVNTFPTGTQNMVTTQRVRGSMSDGKLSGPLTSVRKIESTLAGNPSFAVWGAGRITFEDNRQVGTALSHSDGNDFNMTTIARTLENGTYKTQSYIGNQLSSVSVTYQDKLHGPFRAYADGRPTAPAYYWGGVQVQGANFVSTPEGKPLSTITGIGMNYPRQLSGPFQVRDVHYPSPAAQAGLLPGDIVVSIDGQRLTAVHNTAAIERMLAGAKGEPVVLEVDRPGLGGLQSIRIVRGEFQVMTPGP